MQMLNLSQDKLEQIMPYVDTLVVPVCSIGKAQTGVPDTQDVLFVRTCTEELDRHLSGRILVLPEVIHTTVKLETSGLDQQQEALKTDGSLPGFLFSAVRPYADMGLSNFVILYSTGTDDAAMELLLRQLTEAGLQAVVFRLESVTQIDRFIVPEVISLWSKKSANS